MIDYDKIKKISPPCPICNNLGFQLLADNDRYKMGVETVGCLHCGLVQTWPRPTPEEMSTFYKKYYRQYYQSAISPDTNYIHSFNKSTRLAYTAQLIVQKISMFPCMRVLDIGCAEGTLLANLDKQCEGLQLVLTGVEPSESFSAYAKKTTGCTTYSDINQLKSSEKETFDRIIINHVLEHVDNPVTFLQELWGLLAVEGKIYIDVPDASRYSGAECLHIAHLFHFSQNTLTAAVEKAGFWVLLTEPHSPPHHPHSVFCIAEKRSTQSKSANISIDNEKNAWNKVQHAGAEIETLLYSLKFQLRQSKFSWFFLRKLRDAYKKIRRQ